MENNIIKLTNKEYRFDIDCNVTKLTINVDDNSAIIVKGYDGWYRYRVTGNEISFIIDNNLSDIDRTANIYVGSSMYPDKYAYINITQKGEKYSLVSDINDKNDMSPLIGGEEFLFHIKVKGGDKKCFVKDIREYREIDNNEYMRIPFDKSLITDLTEDNDKGSYILKVSNIGKLTEDVSHFEIVIAHDNNPSMILKLHLQYQDITNNFILTTNSLSFRSNGYSSNRIIGIKSNHIDNIEDNVINQLEWLHLTYGYDCIYAYVDMNENETDRNGSISVYGNTINVSQDKKTIIDNVEFSETENDDEMITPVVDDIEYMSGIELVEIESNVIRLKVNTLENGHYVHNSMIAVSISGKWVDFLLDYDPVKEIHIITLMAEINPFDCERKCLMSVKNAEDIESSQRFLLTQDALSETLSVEIVTD